MAPSLSPGSALADSFPGRQIAISFDDMPGWADDDHQAAMAAFLRTCRRAAERVPRTRPSGVDGAVLARVCAWALAERPSDARAFFEAHFTPYQVEDAGRLTGYFEPQVTASFTRTGSYQHPLYALPPDLVELPASAASLGLEEEVTWGRLGATSFEVFPDRGAIMAGALAGQGLEIAWLADPVDAFFIHIQGSARLQMTDGSAQRINFAGKSGHAYTAIGRTLVEAGMMSLDAVTMDSLRDWLHHAGSEERDAVLATNRSFIFFSISPDEDPLAGPTAAAGVPLTAGRSLAVDRHLHTFGTPIYLVSPSPLPGSHEPLNRLMISQDTGSAIIGPARGDIFIGSGDAAGAIAGAVNQPVSFILLVPNGAR